MAAETYYDPETNLPVLKKQVWEDSPYDFPFAEIMNEGDTITSVIDIVQESQGKVSGSADLTIGSNALNATNDTVQVWLSGGTKGEHYKLSVRAQTASSGKREADVMLYVID